VAAKTGEPKLLPGPGKQPACILFGGYVNSSTVRNCTFNNATLGIEDVLSSGGNRYTNIVLNNVGESLFVLGAQAATKLVLENCEFAAPSN
jgi:hypothetical protein